MNTLDDLKKQTLEDMILLLPPIFQGHPIFKWLEAQIDLAYKAGAKAMEEAIKMEDRYEDISMDEDHSKKHKGEFDSCYDCTRGGQWNEIAKRQEYIIQTFWNTLNQLKS